MATPQLYYQPGGIAESIMKQCPELKQPFNPTIWAPNAHTQSAMGLLRTLTARGSYTRQLVMTSDGGTLGLDWWCGSDKASWAAADAPIVMFIHGINGGSHEGYVKWACVAAASRGWRAVVFNMRGCNGLPLTSARGYNAINTPDVHVAVQSIHSRFPSAPLMAAGYSLGSVLLAKYLAEADNGMYSQPQQEGKACNSSSSSSGGVPEPSTGSGLVAAALVSPPVCLHTTNSKMGRPTSFKFLYNLAVAYKLREYIKEHLPTIQSSGMNIDIDSMLQGWTVSSFDDAVTLRALGYPVPDDYYRHACSTNYIPHIRTPTLIMLSKDDPFLGVLPQEQVQRNPFTLMAATRRGGHLAFLQGWWPLGASYCDAVIDGWLGAALREWRHGMEPTSLAQLSTITLQQQRQPQPLSWVERAAAAGLIDPKQQFDPSSLANILCRCSPQEQPIEQAYAVDAVLNTATAPAAKAISVAGKTAAAAAAVRKGMSNSSTSGSRSPKYSWSFSFSRGAAPAAAPTTAGSGLPGLRESGAWAPFSNDDDGGWNGGNGDSSSSASKPEVPAGSRAGWWGGSKKHSTSASAAADPAVSAGRSTSSSSQGVEGSVSMSAAGGVMASAPATQLPTRLQSKL